MAYKTLLTILHSEEPAEMLISSAGKLARQMNAHLDILCLGIDQVQVGYYFAGADSMLQQSSIDQARERASDVTAKAEELAAREDIRYTVRGVVAQFGALADVIAQVARYADLVILPSPYGAETSTEDEAILESALFSGQASVLVMPDSGLPADFAKRVVVGWNDGTEALNAVRAAIPLLQQAEQTNIAIINPPPRGPDQSGPGRSLCMMLDRHGVKTEVTSLPKNMPRVSDILLSHANDRDASLVVMGAYGHSRFRQAIMGGATRDMLQNAHLPVFMSH